MPDPANEVKRPLAELAREHSGLAVTAMYVLLIAAGMLYEFWLFRFFQINILYYAEAADFLLVPFREPLVVFIALLPIPLFWLYMNGARWLGKKLSRPDAKELDARTMSVYSKFMRAVTILAIALWSVAFTAEYAESVHESIVEGKRRQVAVELATSNGITPVRIAGTVIGTTSRFVFVYDPRTGQTRIIGTEHIAEIVVEPKKPLDSRKSKPTAARKSS
jgi:hypothetical protein